MLVVGGGYYNESKTNPIHNPLSGGRSFFTNKRKIEFESQLEKICKEKDILFIGVGVSQEEWQQKYLYEDGLHPNSLGHLLISKNILKQLNVLLENQDKRE